MIESALQTTASWVSSLPTRLSGGQLLVYEWGLPGRRAAAVQAVQAMKATMRRDSSGSVTACGPSPPPPLFSRLRISFS